MLYEGVPRKVGNRDAYEIAFVDWKGNTIQCWVRFYENAEAARADAEVAVKREFPDGQVINVAKLAALDA